MKKKPAKTKKSSPLPERLDSHPYLSRCSCGYIVFTGVLCCIDCTRKRKGK